MNDFYNSFCFTNAVSCTNQSVAPSLLLLFCFLTCICANNSTVDLRASVGTQKETFLPINKPGIFCREPPGATESWSFHWQISVPKVEKRVKTKKGNDARTRHNSKQHQTIISASRVGRQQL